jgi:hypothetical protein
MPFTDDMWDDVTHDPEDFLDMADNRRDETR